MARGLEEKGFGGLVEREDFFDYGLDAVDLDSLDQLLEQRATAHADAHEAGVLEHEVVWFGIAFAAGEDADEGDLAAPTDAFEGTLERTHAAVFDDAIDAAAAG